MYCTRSLQSTVRVRVQYVNNALFLLSYELTSRAYVLYVFFRMRASFKLPRRGSTVREARAAAAAGASKKTSTRQCNRSVQRVLYTLGAESGCPGAQIRRLQIRLGVTKHLPSSELACATPKLRENSSKRENIC